MRVSPDVLSARKKWQLPAVTILLALIIIIAGVFTGLDTSAVVTQSNRVTKVQVVVANHRMGPGEVFEKSNLRYEVRPLDQAPEGIISSMAELTGKRAGAVIPAGAPITDWLLGSPDELKEYLPEAEFSQSVHTDEIPVTVLDAEDARKEILGQ